jgi:hypothetical protein
MAISKLIKVEMILTVCEMSLITIFLSLVLFIACRDFRFRFILTLCILLLTTDVATALLAIGLGLENTNIHKERPIDLAWEVGSTTLFFNAGSNIAHWIFGFKYWVISREIPNALKATNPNDLKSNENRYKVLNLLGIAGNLAFCIWVAIKRGQLSY